MEKKKEMNPKLILGLSTLVAVGISIGVGFGITNKSTVDESLFVKTDMLTNEYLSNQAKSYLVEKNSFTTTDLSVPFTATVNNEKLTLSPINDKYLVPKTFTVGTIHTASVVGNTATLTPISNPTLVPRNSVALNGLSTIEQVNGALTFTPFTTAPGKIYIVNGDASSPTLQEATTFKKGLVMSDSTVTVPIDVKLNAHKRGSGAIADIAKAVDTPHSILDIINVDIAENVWKLTEEELQTIMSQPDKYKFRVAFFHNGNTESEKEVIVNDGSWSGQASQTGTPFTFNSFEDTNLRYPGTSSGYRSTMDLTFDRTALTYSTSQSKIYTTDSDGDGVAETTGTPKWVNSSYVRWLEIYIVGS